MENRVASLPVDVPFTEPERQALAEAHLLDTGDPLSRFRDLFYLLPNRVYLDGNSLGLLSRPAERALLRALDAWKCLGIEGWTDAEPPWFFFAEDLGRLLAPLIGAQSNEVIVTNSTTVNLHQLLSTLYDPASTRKTILADALNFPSDLYALQSHLRLRGYDPTDCLRLVGSSDGYTLREEDLIEAMTEDVQIAMFPAVLYASGQLLDTERLTREAHRRGLRIGFDCSHSIGAVPHRFDLQEPDFAFWCGYKYLCGGPGAAGGIYLNRRHFGKAPGLSGWFGSMKSAQFSMSPELTPANDAGALQIGTPNILSMAPLQGMLELFQEAGIKELRERSLRLTEFLMQLVDRELTAFGVTICTPREATKRGGHVALRHPEAPRLCKALRAAGVIPDFRPPDTIRLAPVPLYTTFTDCVVAITRLRSILSQRHYETIDREQTLVP